MLDKSIHCKINTSVCEHALHSFSSTPPPPPPPAPGPPSNVQLVAINSSTLMLSWEPPQEPNGVLTGYSYTCKQTSSSMDLETLKTTVTSVLITELSPFTIYTCFVSASTTAGEGVSVTVMNITSEAGNGRRGDSILTFACMCTCLLSSNRG